MSGLFLVSLLLEPDLHHEAVRQELDQTHLPTDTQAVDRYILPALVQISQSSCHDIFCLVDFIIICHGIGAGLQGMVEEFRLDPAGID